MADPRFTERELDVMSILWRLGSGTVAEVREQIGVDLAYTTVLWVLQTLEEKGFVRHEREGRAHRYFALVPPAQAGTRALGRIVDKVFQGSAPVLLAQLVSEHDLTVDELQEMRDLLDRRLAERKGRTPK